MNNKYTKAVAILLFAAAGITTASAQVSQKIGANPFNLTTSAALEIESTTKGFLPPRMDAAQRDAIVTPATGLTIYNKDANLLEVNTGTALAPVWSAATVTAPTVLSKTEAYTIAATDYTILCDATSAGFTITLPDPSTVNGKVYVVSKVDNTENVLTFSPTLIFSKGVTVSALNYPLSVRVQSDGTNWNIIN